MWLSEPISPARAAHKKALLTDSPTLVAGAEQAYPFSLAKLVAERTSSDSVSIYELDIANAAMLVDEDLCLLDGDRGYALIAACVCAPSYWSLGEKLGARLHEVHAPVPKLNEEHGERIAYFLDGLPVLTPFARDNWFVHGSDALFQPGDERDGDLSAGPESWIVRSERQTLTRLDSRYVLFTIDIDLLPLCQVLAHHGAAQMMHEACLTMRDHEIEHAGGAAKHRQLCAAVEAALNV